MEAMDILLQACHAQTTLNLFVESFLRMVQKLLEDSNPNLQILATNSVSFIFQLKTNNKYNLNMYKCLCVIRLVKEKNGKYQCTKNIHN